MGSPAPERSASIKNFFLNVTISVLTTLVTLVLCEAIATVYINHFATEKDFLKYGFITNVRERLASKGVSSMFEPHRYLGYVPRKNYRAGANRHNSLGFRGDEFPLEKPAGEFRIVCMGGSTTYSLKIDDYKQSYPAFLEQTLHQKGYRNVRVINAGVGGWTSWESMINFPLRLMQLKPDMIVVMDALNDIHARLIWPHSAYLPDNSGRRGTPNTVMVPDWKEYSTLYRIFAIKLGLMQSQSSLARSLDADPETFIFTRFTQPVPPPGKRASLGTYKGMTAGEILAKNPPIYFENNLSNLAAMAKNSHVAVVLATYTGSHDLRETTQEYIDALTEMNTVVAKVAQREKVSLFRYDRVFPTDPKFYVDGCHVNPLGAKLQGHVFADYLETSKLLPKPTK